MILRLCRKRLGVDPANACWIWHVSLSNAHSSGGDLARRGGLMGILYAVAGLNIPIYRRSFLATNEALHPGLLVNDPWTS